MDNETNRILSKKITRKQILDVILIIIFVIIVYIFASEHDILERIIDFSVQHEKWEFDEFITVSIVLVPDDYILDDTLSSWNREKNRYGKNSLSAVNYTFVNIRKQNSLTVYVQIVCENCILNLRTMSTTYRINKLFSKGRSILSIKTQSLLYLALFAVLDTVIPIPITAMALIMILYQKPRWFKEWVEDIYRK